MNNIFAYILLIIFFNVAALNLLGQGTNLGARSVAMGGYGVTLFDVWSVNNNQAALAFVDDYSLGVHYQNNFLLKETAYKAVAFALPLRSGVIGLNASSYGFELYNETHLGFSYGLKVNRDFSLGIQLAYQNTGLTKTYGSESSFFGSLGVLTRINQKLIFGAHIFNPTRSKLAEYQDERLPTVMTVGLEYLFSENVLLGAEFEKDLRNKASLKIGLEYFILDQIFLRLGLSTNPTHGAFGFGLKLKKFQIDMSSAYHQTLGMIPSISILYNLPRSLNKGSKLSGFQ